MTTSLSPDAIPLFPLGVVLFPDGMLPLRIFEVRYLTMIKQCHKTGKPFGVVALTQGQDVQRPGPALALRILKGLLLATRRRRSGFLIVLLRRLRTRGQRAGTGHLKRLLLLAAASAVRNQARILSNPRRNRCRVWRARLNSQMLLLHLRSRRKSWLVLVAAIAHSQQLQLAMKGGAFHPDKARRFRDISREPADLDVQIFAFETLARFA